MERVDNKVLYKCIVQKFKNLGRNGKFEKNIKV